MQVNQKGGLIDNGDGDEETQKVRKDLELTNDSELFVGYEYDEKTQTFTAIYEEAPEKKAEPETTPAEPEKTEPVEEPQEESQEPEPAQEPQFDVPTGPLNENPVVVVSTQKMTINGQTVTPAAYNCDGYNYFKIRDLCDLLTKSGYPVNVTYNEAFRTVVITIGKSYAAIGGEQIPAGTPKQIVVSSQSFLLDGKEISFSTYNIDGYNYVNLRQFCAAVGITVSYDEATRTMQIVTK